jgi:hypothetical protein
MDVAPTTYHFPRRGVFFFHIKFFLFLKKNVEMGDSLFGAPGGNLAEMRVGFLGFLFLVRGLGRGNILWVAVVVRVVLHSLV